MNPANAAQTVSPFPTPPEFAQLYTKSSNEAGGSKEPLPPPVQSEFTVFGEEYRLDDEIIRNFLKQCLDRIRKPWIYLLLLQTATISLLTLLIPLFIRLSLLAAPIHQEVQLELVHPPCDLDFRSLPSQGIKQLYPAKFDWKVEMKKLNRSAVAAFLDLVHILIQSPDHPERIEKINDIQMIFINMHHLVNEFRPVQARDQLRFIQEAQVKQLENNVVEFRNTLQEGAESLRYDITNRKIKLEPPPRPSALSRVPPPDDDDDMEMPVLRKVEPQSEDSEQPAFPVRLHAKPSAQDLRERMKITLSQLPSS